MKVFILPAAVAMSLTACASTSPTQTDGSADKERVSDAYVPTGTLIKRKRTEIGAGNTAEVTSKAWKMTGL